MDALYRLSSNEIIDITDGDITERVNEYVAVLISPTFSDGLECCDNSGNSRVIGYAKINDNGTVRNATQNEIDTFDAAEIDDKNDFEVIKAINHFEKHPQFRRIMIALAAILVDEINILRSQHGLADRTLTQLKTAIVNRISKDD